MPEKNILNVFLLLHHSVCLKFLIDLEQCYYFSVNYGLVVFQNTVNSLSYL